MDPNANDVDDIDDIMRLIQTSESSQNNGNRDKRRHDIPSEDQSNRPRKRCRRF